MVPLTACRDFLHIYSRCSLSFSKTFPVISSLLLARIRSLLWYQEDSLCISPIARLLISDTRGTWSGAGLKKGGSFTGSDAADVDSHPACIHTEMNLFHFLCNKNYRCQILPWNSITGETWCHKQSGPAVWVFRDNIRDIAWFQVLVRVVIGKERHSLVKEERVLARQWGSCPGFHPFQQLWISASDALLPAKHGLVAWYLKEAVWQTHGRCWPTV